MDLLEAEGADVSGHKVNPEPYTLKPSPQTLNPGTNARVRVVGGCYTVKFAGFVRSDVRRLRDQIALHKALQWIARCCC